MKEHDVVSSTPPAPPLLPVPVIIQFILPFLSDRTTYNSVRDACREARELSGVVVGVVPPWPEIRVRSPQTISSVAFSPDGRSLAFASRNLSEAFVVDRETGISTVLKNGHDRSTGIVSICYSPDGKLFASAGNDGTVIISTLPCYQVLKECGGFTDVACLAFSPDSTNLMIGCDGRSISCWETAKTSNIMRHILVGDQPPGHNICSISFGPNGFTTAASSQIIQYWDTKKGTYKVVSKVAGCAPCSVASNDGKYIAHSRYNGTAALRRLSDENNDEDEEIVLSAHSSAVSCLAFSPDSTILATGSFDQIIYLWRVAGRKTARIASLRGHTQPIVTLSFSPDGRFLASGSHDRSFRIWNLTQRRMGI